ncbi:hypothetical protein KY334_04320 [Candidatus Woesearchaeota archaeon]|nr:hypothetical protein [Candidatus Woesearchaeota archaeon]
MKLDMKTIHDVKLDQDFQLKTDFKNRVLLNMYQTLQQNVFKIPCLELGRLLRKSIRIRYNAGELQNLSDILYENIQDLKKVELEKEDLLSRFVQNYDIFNFLIPEIEFESNKFEEKEKFSKGIESLRKSFLLTMGTKPYLMKERKENDSEELNALDLYYRKKDNDIGDYLLECSDLKTISKENFDERIDEFSNLEQLVKKVKRANHDFVSIIKRYDESEFRPKLAKILSLGVKIPELYLLEHEEFSQSEFIVRQSAEVYGEFEMPVSKYFQDVIENF